MTNWSGHGGGWGKDAPVYDLNFETMHGKTPSDYPGVWITVQREEPTDHSTGRDCVALYTPDDDPDGSQALGYGGRYYSEGMSCDGEAEHERRIMCFQAAELLYLHAASKDNPFGHLCLGYVYSYDRCEGDYFERRMAWETEEDLLRPYPHLEKAQEHYRAAAEADVAEACYKLGDMLRNGEGCEADLDEAYRWFLRAYELGVRDSPVIWGSAALRLGRAHEEGEGCDQSFTKARTWFERASTGLGIAVRGGESWYRKSLAHAENGLRRVAQELSGKY